MKSNRIFYGIISFVSLIIGMVIYLLFRDINNMVFFTLIPKPASLNTVLFPLEPSIFSNVLRYNIPDMLWFVSGILFFRFLWFYKVKIQTIYIFCFYGTGLFLEISQLSDKVSGTFDLIDLFFMGIGAFVEGLLYKIYTQRRIV